MNMSRHVSKRSGLSCHEKVDGLQPHRLVGGNSRSDRADVLNVFADFARAGLGVLEEIPGLGSQFFSLRSGEVFWLGTNGVTRIK